MSCPAVCWAIGEAKARKLPPTVGMVLVVLANRANDQLYCWPSVQTIADDCSRSVRSAQSAPRRLTTEGLIRVEPRAKHSSIYRILRPIEPSETTGRPKGAKSAPIIEPRVQNLHPSSYMGANPAPKAAAEVHVLHPSKVQNLHPETTKEEETEYPPYSPPPSGAWMAVDRPPLQGFVTVALGALTIFDCPVVLTGGHYWCGLPGKPQLGRDGVQMKRPSTGKGLFTPMAKWSSSWARDRFSSAVIEAIRQAYPGALPQTVDGDAA